MITYLTERLDDRLMVYPSRWREAGGARMRSLLYERLPDVPRLEPGTYLFADLESLTPAALEIARQTCARLRAAPSGFRVVNRPDRVLYRYELLEKLCEAGVNEFRAYRAEDAPRLARFPVFVRRRDDHLGPRTPLLHDAGALARALRFLRLQGHRPGDLLVVEFCDTRGEDGLYRKYAAFIVGERILPRHLLFGSDWVLKQPDLRSPELERESAAYLAGNPHEESLREIARLAGIEYGRVDYGLRGGRLQVWEINTQPTVTSTTPRLTRAFAELELAVEAGAAPVELAFEPTLVRRARRERRLRRVQESVRHGIDRAASSAISKPLTRSLRRWMGQARAAEGGAVPKSVHGGVSRPSGEWER